MVREKLLIQKMCGPLNIYILIITSLDTNNTYSLVFAFFVVYIHHLTNSKDTF